MVEDKVLDGNRECFNIRTRLSEYIDNELSDKETKTVHGHLWDCEDCKDYYEEMREAWERMRKALNSGIPKSDNPKYIEEQVRKIRERIPLRVWIKNMCTFLKEKGFHMGVGDRLFYKRLVMLEKPRLNTNDWDRITAEYMMVDKVYKG